MISQHATTTGGSTTRVRVVEASAVATGLWRWVAAFLVLALTSTARPETRFDAARFTRVGARGTSFFDRGSTGSIIFSIPPGQGTTSEVVHLVRLALSYDDPWTTDAVYDPGTTLTLVVGVADCQPGAHYVLARLPQSRRMRWTHFEILPPLPHEPPEASVSTSTLRARWHKLVLRKMGAFYDEDTTGTWLGSDPETDFHWMREDAYYAVALLDDSATTAHERANAILRTIAAAQDRVTTSPTYGWFYTNAADLRVPHNASTFFIPPILARLILSPPPTLAPETLEALRTALWHVTEGVASRFTFPPVYENFYFMGTATLALAGEIFGRSDWIAGAHAKLVAAHEYFQPRGASAEWASPVYTAVSDWALGLIEQHVTSALTRQLARHIRHRLWLDVAMAYAPSRRQQTGPFSRVYEDGLRGGGGLTGFALAWMLGLEGFDAPMRLAEMVAARHGLDIHPAYWIASMNPSLLPESTEIFLANRALPTFTRQRNFFTESAIYGSSSFSLGSLDATTASLLGMEGLVAQVYESTSPTGLAPVFARLGSTSDDVFGYGVGTSTDMFGFQAGGRVLWVGNRVFPSSSAPSRQVFLALLADERFSRWEDLQVDGVAVNPPVVLSLGSVVTARRAGAYLCAIPLVASSLGNRLRSGAILRTGDHLVLVSFGLDSPTAQPIAGLRFEAAWALALTEATAWNSYQDFVAECVTTNSVEVVESGEAYRIVWDDGRNLMEGVFDRISRQWTSRKIDGIALGEAPLLQSPLAVQAERTGDLLVLRDFIARDLPVSTWIVYPEGAAGVLLGHPGKTDATIQTNWSPEPLNVGPYELRRLVRPSSSRIAEWLLFEGGR